MGCSMTSPLTELQALGQAFDAGILIDASDIRIALPEPIIARCKACGEILCNHTDVEFSGVVPAREG